MSAATALTEEYVYRVAPDGQSMKAALGLLRDDAFSGLRMSNGGRDLRASCQGSGGSYAVHVDLSDPDKPRTGCDCVSRKLPCKHALGLLLLAVRSPERFERDPDQVIVLSSAESLTVAKPRKQTAAKTAPPADLDEALYRDILAEPEDDGLRLIYADWLEDNGRPDRAEFIRTQMELATTGLDASRRKSLAAREKALWSAHRAEWLATVHERLRERAMTFHKGFLEELSGPPRTWAGCWDSLFSRHPIYRLRVTGSLGKKEAGTLAVVPQMARVRVLDLSGSTLNQPVTTLGILFASPFFAGLRRLDLTGAGISSREAGLVAETPAIRAARELILADNDIGPRGAEALANAPRAAGLTELSLANNPIGDDGAKALVRSPSLDAVARLDLTGVELGRGVKEMLREKFAARVVLD